MSQYRFTPDFSKVPQEFFASRRIAVVYALFNDHITVPLLEDCVSTLTAAGVPEENVMQFSVPGSLELPYLVSRLASYGFFDAIVAIGCVIKGDTYHFDIVCNESANGLSLAATEWETPVINGILTVYEEEQALERLETKGKEFANAALHMCVTDHVIDTCYEMAEQMDAQSDDADDGGFDDDTDPSFTKPKKRMQ